MYIPQEIIIYIFSFTKKKYNYHILNKNYHKKFIKRKIDSINKIKKWYLNKPIHIYNNMNLEDIPKSLVIRNILQETIFESTLKAFITLPEFICLQIKKICITQKMRLLKPHKERKKSDIVKFLLNKDIKNCDIFNSFRMIISLQQY